MDDPAAAVRQRISELAARRGAPGAQYVVIRDGSLWLEHVHGFADVPRARRVTPQTTFNAYSITKTVTAAAVLALSRAGSLDLDAPIGAAAGVEGLGAYGTVRETLLHRAGFRNPSPLRWVHLAQGHAVFDEAAFVRAQAMALRGTRRRWARSAYSNVGYLMLGLAVERAARDAFVRSATSLVLDPLALAGDEHLGFAIADAGLHAPGHLRSGGLLDRVLGLLVERSSIVESVADGWVKLRLHHVNGSAYGGLMANARGLARFGHAVLRGDGPRSPHAPQPMLEAVPGPGPCRSLGWFCGALGRHRWLAHAGGGLGAYGELRLYPELGIVSALLTNGSGLRDARCLDIVDGAWINAASR